MEGVARAADTKDLTTEWGAEGGGGAGSQRGAGRPVRLGTLHDLKPLRENKCLLLHLYRKMHVKSQ